MPTTFKLDDLPKEDRRKQEHIFIKALGDVSAVLTEEIPKFKIRSLADRDGTIELLKFTANHSQKLSDYFRKLQNEKTGLSYIIRHDKEQHEMLVKCFKYAEASLKYDSSTEIIRNRLEDAGLLKNIDHGIKVNSDKIRNTLHPGGKEKN